MRWISLQLQVINSPFNQEQVELLNRLLPTLSESQRVWLSGYLAAFQASVQESFPNSDVQNLLANRTEQLKSKEVTILYGSQTGNANRQAENIRNSLKNQGFEVTISSMNDFKTSQLKKIQNLLIVVSTYGEGEPPDNAISFYEYLHSKRAPKLDNLQFSVLSLGDSSYEFFCQTGKDFDKRLAELGGKRIYPRFDCDLDYEVPAAEWLEGIIDSFSHSNDGGSVTQSSTIEPENVEVVYSRTNPYKAEVLDNINLNGRGSNKETHHLELSLEGSGLIYEPGDCLGIFPVNDGALVDLLLDQTKWNPEEIVTVNKQGDTRHLRDALLQDFEITVLTKALIKQVAQLSTNEALQELLENDSQLKAYLQGRDLIDLIRDFGSWGNSAQEFVSVFRKMPPRLYSISSSLLANPEEVHLTIGAVRYEAHGRERKGVCSILCAERIKSGDSLPIFIQHNKNFKLPTNPDVPIIMVGTGTGIAPFRSFLQERAELGAQGKSWVFFGDQHFVTDFLYQTEWQKWLKDGMLTKMDLAFSRDTDEKIYVQNRMLQHSKELFDWLEEGAFLYICGNKRTVGIDVHQTLLEIIKNEGSISHEKAEEYLANLKQQKRYQRDVY